MKNYYAMPDNELESALDKIRSWCDAYPYHKRYEEVRKALSVCYQAWVYRQEKDPFILLVIDTICK